MAVSLLRRLAATAPPPVALVPGRDAWLHGGWLRTRDDLDLVDSPRHATVLLVVGAVPVDHLPAVSQLHDQMPGPRAAVWWTAGPLTAAVTAALPEVAVVAAAPVAEVRRVHAAAQGGRDGSRPVGPSDNPTAWQGVGPHGQGGEGMMGGQPYGRSMAMTGDDVRDGLQLDRVRLTLGPHHAALPPGLTLDLELQGDVVAAAGVRAPGDEAVGSAPPLTTPEETPAVVWVADLLRLHGLPARAEGLLRAAMAGRDLDGRLADARRRLRWSLQDVGAVDGADALDRLDHVIGERTLPRPIGAGVLAQALVGMEWSAAVTTCWSIDHRHLAARVAT